MELHTRDIANVLLVEVTGRIDHTTARDFETALLPLLQECQGEAKKALLDLHAVHYMSSAGLRVLMLAAKQCQKQNASIVVAALSEMLQEVFRISRFDTVFTIFESVPAALDALSPTAAVAYQKAWT